MANDDEIERALAEIASESSATSARGKKGKKKGVKVNKIKIKAEAVDEEHDAALAAQAADTSSFPRLQRVCSLCGAEPASEDDAWKCCAKCGETRYCSRACQVESWKQPCAHKASCGCKLPTPNVIASGTLVEVVTLLHEFGRADVDLAEACVTRIAALLPESKEMKRDAYESGTAHATCVAMAAHPAAAAVQREGLTALGHATLGDKAYKAAVVEAGGPETIVAAMRHLELERSVQAKGCWALRNTALGVAAVQQAVVAAGAAVACVRALRAHGAADATLATEAFAALANMTGGDTGCQAAVLGAEAAEAVFDSEELRAAVLDTPGMDPTWLTDPNGE